MLEKIANAVPGISLHAALIGSLAAGVSLHAQDTSKLIYDVSTVKPHDSGDRGMSWGTRDGKLMAVNVTLKNLIAEAWGVRPDQVAGEPAWTDDEHWDVTGKVTDSEEAVLKKLTREDAKRMEQTLLAERFHIKVHLETRTAPVFNLVPARSGIKLKMLQPAAEDDKPSSSAMPRGSLRVQFAGGGYEMTGHGIGMGMLTGNIAGNLQQTVIDKTGVPDDAIFDFTLKYAPATGTDSSQNGDAPSMREALEQQLGLHLEPTRGPVLTVVVDHVDKPAAN
jgi:uncharacterized protein (TIGR03435 family)